jgi:hypothetical protein
MPCEATVKITVLKTAQTKAELSELGQLLDSPGSLSLLSLIDPYQNILNMLDDRVAAATLWYHEMSNQQHYHSIGVLDINGITYTVNDRQTTAELKGKVKLESECADVLRKARYYDLIVKSGGTHKMRIILTDEPRRFIGEVNSRADLERYLEFIDMEEYLRTPIGPKTPGY